jgi:ankyrin repeat protein
MTQPLPRGRTLLHCLRDGQEHLVRPLIGLGLSVDVQDAAGNTPLHAAAAAGQADVLRLLVMNSADPALRNKRGRDALLCAVSSKVNTLVRANLQALSLTQDTTFLHRTEGTTSPSRH